MRSSVHRFTICQILDKVHDGNAMNMIDRIHFLASCHEMMRKIPSTMTTDGESIFLKSVNYYYKFLFYGGVINDFYTRLSCC